jgi:hypothetical protein
MALYKSLTNENKGPYSNFDYTPYLPKKSWHDCPACHNDGKDCEKCDGEGGYTTYRPDKWLPKIKQLELCVSGWHGSKDGQILEWLNANIYKIETRGKILSDNNKFTTEQIRLVRKCEGWNKRTARLFACDCAEHVLPIFKTKYPSDERSRIAIETARRFANGKATSEELAAAWAAAWDATRATARAAASTAAWDAASTAANTAARAAASTAASTATWAAVWAAARAAAWDATRATARAAASTTARAAAWDAEKKWQTRKLMRLLKVNKQEKKP